VVKPFNGIRFISPGLCCFSLSVLILAGVITRADWSAPQEIMIPSERGPITVVKQTNLVGAEVVAVFALLYSPATRSLWVGPPQDQYFSMGGQIWSASAIGTGLHMIPSAPRLTTRDVNSSADKWIQKFRRGLTGWYDYKRGRVGFELADVFGHATFSPLKGFNFCSIVKITPAQDGVTFALRSASGKDLEVKFSREFRLLSATENGTLVSTLLDGRLPGPGQPFPWRFIEVVLESSKGRVTASACDRHFVAAIVHNNSGHSETKPMISYAAEIRVLALNSGDIWIGPAYCKLAMMNGQILGFTVNRLTAELLVFVGPQTKIPMGDQDRIPAFAKVLRAVEGQVSRGSITPDKTFKLSSLFHGDLELASDRDVALQSLSLVTNNVELDVVCYGVNKNRHFRV
jgi:hypothetical protein